VSIGHTRVQQQDTHYNAVQLKLTMQYSMFDLSIMLCKPQSVSGFHSRPHIADELLSLLVAPPRPRGVLQQRHQGHQGVVGPHHTGQHSQWQYVQVV